MKRFKYKKLIATLIILMCFLASAPAIASQTNTNSCKSATTDQTACTDQTIQNSTTTATATTAGPDTGQASPSPQSKTWKSMIALGLVSGTIAAIVGAQHR
ncbi:MAG: hypothetical protein NTZ49_01780 [Candidatus Parcubacteria bacterium]|nr:hypothetical protein [Candidatus Parcubacteria bacterium]